MYARILCTKIVVYKKTAKDCQKLSLYTGICDMSAVINGLYRAAFPK